MNLFQVTKKQPSGGLELKTATGDIASFKTNYSEPLPPPFNSLNVKCTIVASGGGGTPSTPIPIVGYSELNLVRCGKNLFDKTATDTNNGYYPNAWLNSVNGIVPDTDANISEYIQVPANTNFYIKGTTYGNLSICFYDINKTLISGISYNYRTEFAFTTPPNTAYLRFSIIKANIDITQLELGSTATAYAPYNGTPYLVQFGQTVYGGVYDANSGKVSITSVKTDMGDMYWSYNSNYGFISTSLRTTIKGVPYTEIANVKCDIFKSVKYDDVTQRREDYAIGVSPTEYGFVVIADSDYTSEYAFNQYIRGHELAYELATPQTVQLTPTQVQAIVGDNNVFCDTGSVEVKYLDVV